MRSGLAESVRAETAEGVVAYAADRDARIAAFVVSGRLFVADLVAGGARAVEAPRPVFDPRPDPSGRRVAFVHDRALHVVQLADSEWAVAWPGSPGAVSWGTAEFVAAEEMGRSRGYWWAPDGDALLVARVDEAPVDRLWISDVAHPGSTPRAVRYPRAGSANASVQLHVLRLDGAPSVPVAWDAETYPYLARAAWDEHGPFIAVQTRARRRVLRARRRSSDRWSPRGRARSPTRPGRSRPRRASAAVGRAARHGGGRRGRDGAASRRARGDPSDDGGEAGAGGIGGGDPVRGCHRPHGGPGLQWNAEGRAPGADE